MPLTSSSRTERFRQGKALRHKTPREAHANLEGIAVAQCRCAPRRKRSGSGPGAHPGTLRADVAQPVRIPAGGRRRHGATDLAAQPMAGISVQAGGDSHLMNFGAFVTPEDNILFDVNDFDETL